ncbi:MAG: hypothetical protein NT163_08420 [Chlorobiales bacterium]|jgi:hypothetical protein|nr:hypothetical protein [Chlorobiales bacterium]
MADETMTKYQGEAHALPDIIGNIIRFPFEVVKVGVGSAANVIVFVGTTSINLVSNVLSTVTQVLQGISSAITPKQ